MQLFSLARNSSFFLSKNWRFCLYVEIGGYFSCIKLVVHLVFELDGFVSFKIGGFGLLPADATLRYVPYNFKFGNQVQVNALNIVMFVILFDVLFAAF